MQDARRHGVAVRPVDVLYSDADCTLEDLPHVPGVRLGLRMVLGLGAAAAQRIVAKRGRAPFDSAEELALHEMKRLAAADALASLSGHRRQQVWDTAGLQSAPQLLRAALVDEEPVELRAVPEGEEIMFDYAATGLTLRRHPLALLRTCLARRGFSSAAQLEHAAAGSRVAHCGLVTLRQQPQTAGGTVFVSLEDETGVVQVPSSGTKAQLT